MNILPVVYQIIMLFILLGFGLMLRKKRVFTDPVIKGMNGLVMTVTWPSLMILTTQREYTPETLRGFLTIFLGSILILAIGMLVLFAIFRRTRRDMAPLMAMLSIMPNAGFFGIPIIEAMYGADGLLYLAAYIVGFNMVLWTLCISTYTGFNLKALKNLLNPGIVCAVIGIALFLMRIKLPTPLYSTVSQLAAVNTPLSMLITGSRMDMLTPRSLLDGKLWLVTAIKLIAMPLAVLPVLKLCGISGMTLVILLVTTAMPAAASGQMLTERYGGDVYFSAKGTSVSTLCSILTLPLMLWLAGLVA